CLSVVAARRIDEARVGVDVPFASIPALDVAVGSAADQRSKLPRPAAEDRGVNRDPERCRVARAAGRVVDERAVDGGGSADEAEDGAAVTLGAVALEEAVDDGGFGEVKREDRAAVVAAGHPVVLEDAVGDEGAGI